MFILPDDSLYTLQPTPRLIHTFEVDLSSPQGADRTLHTLVFHHNETSHRLISLKSLMHPILKYMYGFDMSTPLGADYTLHIKPIPRTRLGLSI